MINKVNVNGKATSYTVGEKSSIASAINQEKIPSNIKVILVVTSTQFERNRFSRTDNFLTRRISRTVVVIKPIVTSTSDRYVTMSIAFKICRLATPTISFVKYFHINW